MSKPLKASWSARDILKAFFWLLVWLIIIYPIEISLEKLFPDLNLPWDTLLSSYLIYLFMFILVWIFAVRKSRHKWRAVGFRSFSIKQAFTLAVVGFLLSKAVGIAYGYLVREFLGYVPSDEIFIDVPDLFGTGFIGIALAIFSVGIFFPIIEEVFFRGFIYTYLRDRYGIVLGIILNGIIFGVFHLHPWLILPITVMGFFLAYFYETTGSLGSSIFLHSLNNIVSVVTLYIVALYGG